MCILGWALSKGEVLAMFFWVLYEFHWNNWILKKIVEPTKHQGSIATLQQQRRSVAGCPLGIAQLAKNKLLASDANSSVFGWLVRWSFGTRDGHAELRMRQIWNDADRNTYWFVSFWFYHGWFLWYIMVSTPWWLCYTTVTDGSVQRAIGSQKGAPAVVPPRVLTRGQDDPITGILLRPS